MKLKLVVEKGVALLDVLEEVQPAHVEVLRAGLSKLLNDGRTHIVIDLSGATQLNESILGELVAFNHQAVQRGGEVVLVGQAELMREALTRQGLRPGHAAPRNFPTKSAATAALADRVHDAAPDGADKESELARLEQKLASLRLENEALRARSAQLSGLDELRRLRRENGALRRELSLLGELLGALKAERRPAHAAPLEEERLGVLEATLTGFLREKIDGL